MANEIRLAGYWQNQSDEELMNYARQNCKGMGLAEFQKGKGTRGCAQHCLKRGIMDRLVDEGTIIRICQKGEYWSNWENFEAEIKKAIEKLGHFPRSCAELGSIGMSMAGKAAKKYHGGMKKVKETFKQKVKHNGQDLRNNEYIIARLKAITVQIGHFPTSGEIKNLDGGIYHAICRYHGSYQEIKRLCGFEDGRADWGRYNDYENILADIRAKEESLGRFPTWKELPNGLISSLYQKHKKTWSDIKRDLGQPLDKQKKQKTQTTILILESLLESEDNEQNLGDGR